MIREAPAWFNDELERIGGTNRYGDPLFKLTWSEDIRALIGGRFNDGFVGYRNARVMGKDPCWVLMIWEGPETFGDPDLWEFDYRQPENGLLACGSFPKYGRYRVLKQMLHRQLEQRELSKMVWNPVKKHPEMRRLQDQRFVTYRMEPTGLILDLMLPMLMAWKRLAPHQRLEALKDRKERQDAELDRTLKDAVHGSRVRRSSALVQKRAEFIEKHMDQAMRIASGYSRGMMTVG